MCLWQNYMDVERCNLSLLLVEIIMPSQKEGKKTFTTTMSSMELQEGWQYYL